MEETPDRTLTDEQGLLITERLTSIMELMVHRLRNHGITVSATTVVTVGGHETSKCRKAFASAISMAGDTQCLDESYKRFMTYMQVDDRLENLKEDATRDHALDHIRAIFVPPPREKVDDNDLIPLLAMVATDEEWADMKAGREVKYNDLREEV